MSRFAPYLDLLPGEGCMATVADWVKAEEELASKTRGALKSGLSEGEDDDNTGPANPDGSRKKKKKKQQE